MTTPLPALLRGRAFWDVAFVLLIFFGGARLGSGYLKSYQLTNQPEFGQAQFGAAVSLACGRGFASPLVTPTALSDFLSRKVDSLSCDELPDEPSVGQTNFTQKLYRYLMTAVALQWKWSGVSWNKLPPLFGVLFGLTLAAAYALFRLAGGPLLAIIGVLPLAVSAHHLFILPQLRDYAKAPFMLLLLVIMARLALPPFRPRRSLLLAAAFGLVLGVGFGFRNDLLINVPPFVAVVLVLTPGRWREHLRLKAACLALAAVIFVATAWPILKAYGSGSNTGHVAVLGYMSAFDGPLGLTRPAYDLGRHYVDGFAATVIFNHGVIKTGHVPDYLSADYERVAMSLVTALARHWPADIFARGCAAALQILELPFTVGWHSVPVPIGLSGPSAQSFYDKQMSVMRWFSGLGLPMAAVAVVMVGAARPSAAVALVLLLIFYCGYPAVQFQTRHLFHLEFIGWWALLFVGSSAAGGAWRLARTRRAPAFARQSLRGSLVAVAAMLSFTVLPLSALRYYQQRHVAAMFEGYLSGPRAPMPLSASADAGNTLFTVDGLWADRLPATPAPPKYLVAEFSADGCGTNDLPVVMKYEVDPRSPVNDFSFTVRLAISPAGPTRQLVPAYLNGDWSHFVGFAVPAGYEQCLKSASRIEDLSAVPVLMNASLAPGWQDRDLFQRLAALETPDNGAVVKALPAGLMAPRQSPFISVALPIPNDVAPGVTRDETGRITGRVIAVTPELRLVHYPETAIELGSVLRVRGIVHRGGLLIGLLKNEAWFARQAVDEPGPFTILLGASEAGRFGILVADHSPKRWRMEQHSLMRRAAQMFLTSALTDDFELTDVTWLR